ncbi:FAD-binding domain-containing protein [Pleomassaria siparia CBS 279.74]|uniref:FAD-binding domain-containing protein n=1 Tax=Pleomassaria siparia CBS 279.74 TaxID=1314801 RepID=A0A6G1JVG0_9PLEO|nr:FAD-binding domain-containing protein [Pleomassaria siparia CBS 279.74]
MRVAPITPVITLALAAGVITQASGAAFEPQDFNVTAALENIGVDVSALPEPKESDLSKRSLLAPCSLACTALTILFGTDKVLSDGTSAYDSFTGSYWSAQQGELNPSCVFKPAKTVDVSTLVLIARLYQCPFAVKGGGHAAWAGASSIEDGITVSMENFKQVQVSSNKQTVDIGPGLRWVDVYTAVEKDGLSVVGGRMAPVGVSGLILGGGISHFSNRLGWACDNVASFELVTASGFAITVSPTSYADLYWALRGGGNNFGIVTNFKLVASPLGQMWGGQRIYLEDTFTDILNAINQFANITSIQDTTGLRNMSEMANLLNEGAPAPGAYQTWWGISLKMDRQFLQFILDTFYAQEATVADVEKILLIMAIQPITEGVLKAMQKNNGNALGLDPKNGPYFILNFNAAWNNKEDEPKFHHVIATTIDLVKAEAKRRSLDNTFVYLNYASEYQDTIGSYGAANKQRLITISNKYDPTQVFQYLQPGGFKLTKGAPNPNTP